MLARTVSGAMVFLVVLSTSLAAIDRAIKPTPADVVFGLTKVWQIHLQVTAENWKAMQPPATGFSGFGPPQPPATGTPPRPSGAPLVHRPGSFGFEFEYVPATIELDGQKLEQIGLRFKGNGTYASSQQGRKRPFKVDFNRFLDDQKFYGLQQLNLHNDVMDPTHLRQVLSYPVFQDAGIPAPRTAYAEIKLTIDGECSREPLGLYTLVEEVDKAFLKRHYGSSKGLLLKPEGTQGLEYKGEDWKEYAWFEPKTDPTEAQTRQLIALTRLIHQSDDDQFRREIRTYLNTDQFARFLAANTLLANMDSFLTQVHNYYLYLPPDTNRFEFLPWDMDLSLGAFFMAGTAEQLQDLSIQHPHMGSNRVIERLMAWPEFKVHYRNELKQLTEAQFAESGLTRKRLAVVKAAMQPVLDRETQRVAAAAAKAPRSPGGFGPPGGGMFGNQPPLETFFDKRRESIMAQLSGKSKGREPGMSFGPPGGFGGPPGGFGPGNFHAPQFFKASDRDQNQQVTAAEFTGLADQWFANWDRDPSRSLSAEELTKGLNAALAMSSPGDAAPGGFRPPTGFGPGTFLAPPLMKLADTGRDGSLSAPEWTALFTGWFQAWDKAGDGSLDEADIRSGLNAAFKTGLPPGAPRAGPPSGASDPQSQSPPLPRPSE